GFDFRLVDLDADGRLDYAVSTPAAVATAQNLQGLPEGIDKFGTSTPGPLGGLGLAANGSAHIGNSSFLVTCTNGPSGALGLLLLSGAPDLLGTQLLGLGVAFYVEFFATPFLAAIDMPFDVGNYGRASVPIPNEEALAGIVLYAQAI